MKTDKKPLSKKLRHKYRLVLYNDKTYAEVWHQRLSPLNVAGIIGIVGLIVVAGVVALIAFTPMRELIPGYPNNKTRMYIVRNALRLDSLQRQIQQWVVYNDNISRILTGQEPIDIENKTDEALQQHYKDITLKRSKADSLFRLQIENTDAAAYHSSKNVYDKIENLRFVTPLWGRVVDAFAPEDNGHCGITINSLLDFVSAAADGTVVATYQTPDNGYIIVVQHGFNLVTIYKHLSKIIVKAGKNVRAGDYVGIRGNKAQTSGGISLVFEMWHNGAPVDPENYLRFY
jgi:murein DD-endopeptidase MepM/ murein hydrolase activator NlpD